MNRVTLIGIAGLIVLAAAIALNYWNGREPGEEPVVAEPTKASAPAEDTSAAEATAPAAPQEPSPAEASSEVAESSPTQEGAADSEGEDEGAPSGTDPSTADSLSGQGTAAAQPASPGDDKAPTAGPTTPSEPSAAASPAPADEPAASSPTSATEEALASDAPTVGATEETAPATLDSSEQVAAQAPVSGSEPASALAEPVEPSQPQAPEPSSEEPEAAAEEPGAVEAAPAETQAAAVDAVGEAEAEAPAIVVSPEAVEVPPIAPSFDVVRVNPRGDAVLAGRAEPDAEVIIHDDGEEIGRVMADSRGEWVFVPTEPLAPGNRELSLSARRGEEAEVPSDDTVVLVVPEPGKDVAGEVTGGAPTGTLALQIPRVGGAPESEEAPVPTIVLQTPSGEEPAPEELALRAVDYGGGGQLVLSGNAPSGARLQVYLDDSLIGIAEVEDGGAWQLVPEGAVEAGVYTMRVDQVDEAGKVISRIELPFARAEPVVALPEETIVVVQPGNNLWQIARRTYGAGIKYTVIYDSNRDQIRDPHLIYPGQIFTLERVN